MGRRKIKPDLGKMAGKVNPLTVVDFKVLVRKRVKKHKNDKGENVDVEVELEFERYVKVFVGADNRKAIASLFGASKGLFLWIMYELENGKDYVWINRERYMKEMEIGSINTYKSAVEEMVGKGLIAASLLKDVYWINPRLFFCGSRINKYPEHVEEWKPKKEKEEK